MNRTVHSLGVIILLALIAAMDSPTVAKAETNPQPADAFFKSVRFIPLTGWEEGILTGKMNMKYNSYQPNAVYADRKVYWNDDPLGQFLVTFIGTKNAPVATQGKQLKIDVTGPGGPISRMFPMTTPKAALLLAVNTLKPGHYKLVATVDGVPPAEVEFDRADKAKPAIPFPAEGLEIQLDPQAIVRDGDWPICTGVPFPQDTMYDLSKLVLYEDGKPIPSQIEKTSTWHPEVPGAQSSISWARLSFVGKYTDGQPRKYTLRLAPAGGAAADKALVATRTTWPTAMVAKEGDLITVDTGAVKFQVSTGKFAGVQSAWYDPTGLGKYDAANPAINGASGGGAYLVDAQGTTYEAAGDAKPEVKVEDGGPVRVVIAAEGWYTRVPKPGEAASDDPSSRLCKFCTRIIAYAGEPMIRVNQHTIVTFDSNKVQLADVGFRIGVPGAKGWSMGADGKAVAGDMPAKDSSVFMHQYRWDKLRIVRPGEPAEASHQQISGASGGRSDGWFTLDRNSPGAVSVLVRDFWQKFPKEMEIDPAGFTMHFWPKHGIESFTKDEMADPKNAYKLWYFEQGKLLNLKYPEYVYDALKALQTTPNQNWFHWDPEQTNDHAEVGNAQGISIGNEFVLRFHPAAATDQKAQAALFQLDPHARSDPKWNVKTLVEGKMAAYDPRKYPVVENDVNTFWPDYLRVVIGVGTEYGMFSYADMHDNWEPGPDGADLHRVASASHYRNVSQPWLLYFRGSAPDILTWGAANTDHYMDIDTVQYTSIAKDDKGRLGPEFMWHQVGAMYHAKGFTPWGGTAYGQPVYDAYSGVQGHWINPDAFRYRYLMEGNQRAWDLYMLWSDAIKQQSIFPTTSREAVETFGEMLSLYTTTWDPDLLPMLYRHQQTLMTSLPMIHWASAYDHPTWHRFWYSRAYDLTRDERIKAAFIDYAKTYRNKPAVMAWLYEVTGDQSYLQAIMPEVYDFSHQVYRNPDDPLSGCRTRFAAYESYYYLDMPYFLQALEDAGIKEITPGAMGKSCYLTWHSRVAFDASSPAAMVLVLKPEDREFTVRLESIPGYDTYEPIYRIIGPTGQIVFEKDKQIVNHQTRYMGGQALVTKVPKDGKTGLYRIDLRGELVTLTPFTDLPIEGVLLDPGIAYRAEGRCDAYLMPVGERSHLQFKWAEGNSHARMWLGYIRFEDAKGNVLLETTLLGESKRSAVTLDVDASKNPPPYHLYQFSGVGPTVEWTGNAKGVVEASTAENAKALLAELSKGIVPVGALTPAPAKP